STFSLVSRMAWGSWVSGLGRIALSVPAFLLPESGTAASCSPAAIFLNFPTAHALPFSKSIFHLGKHNSPVVQVRRYFEDRAFRSDQRRQDTPATPPKAPAAGPSRRRKPGISPAAPCRRWRRR